MNRFTWAGTNAITVNGKRSRMKNKLAGGEELQSYFTKRVAKIITSKMKKMIE
jgi:hypothetical protein